MGCGVPYSKADEVTFFSSKASYQHEMGEEKLIEEALDELIFDDLNLKKFRNQDLEQELFRVTRLYFSHINNDFQQMRNNGLFSDNDPKKKQSQGYDFNPKQIDKNLFDKTINIVFQNKWKYSISSKCNAFAILKGSHNEDDDNDEEDNIENEKTGKEFLEPEVLKRFILRVNGKYSEVLLKELEKRKRLFGFVFIPIRRDYQSYYDSIDEAIESLNPAYKENMIKTLNETVEKFYLGKEAEIEKKIQNLRNNERDFEDDYDDDDDLNDLKNFEDEKPKRLYTYEVIAEFIRNYEEDFIIVNKRLAGVYNFKRTLLIISEMIIRSLLGSNQPITAESLANYFIEKEKAFLHNFEMKDSKAKKVQNQQNSDELDENPDDDDEDVVEEDEEEEKNVKQRKIKDKR